MVQANHVKSLLIKHHKLAEDRVEIVPLSTRGDREQTRLLAEIGGKGLFTEEIEAGLMDGSIDIAVHSMKDVATILPDGLGLTAFLEREDPRDALIAQDGITSLADIPQGGTIGTASLRRAAQAKAKRPDVTIVPLRGNVATRMGKIADGHAHASFLAAAGLNRLGIIDKASAVLETDEMLPALCQGIVGVEQRLDDEEVTALMTPLNNADSMAMALAERAVLADLDGSCRTPIAGLAVLDPAGESLTLTAGLYAPDGSASFTATATAPRHEAAVLGAKVAGQLRQDAGQDFLDRIAEER